MSTHLPLFPIRPGIATNGAVRWATRSALLVASLLLADNRFASAQSADTSKGVPTAKARAAALADPQNAKIIARLSALSADSMEGRQAGTAGGARARAWIIRELRAIGVKPVDGEPMSGSFEQSVKLRVRPGAPAGARTDGANIVARIPGKSPSAPIIVLSAHYDHLGVRNGVVYNGADDDASGCIALLTIAERLLKSGTNSDVLLVFFDSEESGLVGATTFVEAPAVPLSRIAIDLSLDMVSRQDNGALWVAGLSHYPFLKSIVEPVAARSKVKILLGHDTKGLKPDDDWTNSSDHAAFHKKGIPFLYLGVEDHSDYHQPGDDVEKIDPVFYRHVIGFTEALLRAVDVNVQKFPPR